MGANPCLCIGSDGREAALLAATGEKPVSTLPDEIEEIFREHHDLIFRTAYRITGSASDAEDVLQTVFLRLLGRDPSAARLLENRQGYLHRAAVNVALDVVRDRQRHAKVSIEDFPIERADSDWAKTDPRELEDSLRRSIAALNPRAAEIFVLRFVEGYKYAEIARMLSISHVQVAVTLHRTRRRLQKELRSHWGGKS